MTYPQPGPYQPMPAYPGGVDPYNRPPSGGTAITAGVFAILGAVWALIVSIATFSVISDIGGSYAWVVWMQAIVYPLEVILLLPGAILLMVHKSAGRWMVVLGCLVHIAMGITSLIAAMSISTFSDLGLSGPSTAFGTIGLIIVLAPAVATLVLALVPLTGKWCAVGAPRPGMPPMPPMPPQQPGYYPQR